MRPLLQRDQLGAAQIEHSSGYRSRDYTERSLREVNRHTSIPSGALWQMLLLGHMFPVNIVEL